MKKVAVIALFVFLGLALQGCGKKEAVEATETKVDKAGQNSGADYARCAGVFIMTSALVVAQSPEKANGYTVASSKLAEKAVILLGSEEQKTITSAEFGALDKMSKQNPTEFDSTLNSKVRDCAKIYAPLAN